MRISQRGRPGRGSWSTSASQRLMGARAHGSRDLDALAAVLERTGARARGPVAEAAQQVLVRPEQVRIDGDQRHTLRLGVLSQRGVVVDGVPGDVERDRRAASRSAGGRAPRPRCARAPSGRPPATGRRGTACRSSRTPTRASAILSAGEREHLVVVHGASLPDRCSNYESAFDITQFESQSQVLTSTRTSGALV